KPGHSTRTLSRRFCFPTRIPAGAPGPLRAGLDDRLGRALGARFAGVDRRAETCESPVQGDLHGVRLQLEELRDLFRGQVGAVAKRDQLAVALVERLERLGDLELQVRPVLVSLDELLRN